MIRQEESVIVALVGNIMLNNKLARAAISILAYQENFSVKSTIKKLIISKKKVAGIINGTHTLMRVGAREVGSDGAFVLLNFNYQD